MHASVTRSLAKASGLYENSGWDLVDAVNEGKVALAAVKTEDLPENMQAMSEEERVAYVQTMADKRSAVRAQIGEASVQRAEFIAANTPENPEAAALHEALIQMLHEQCEGVGFVFEAVAPAAE